MSLNDPLANALSAISNAEKVGKTKCTIGTGSKIILSVLQEMEKEGYLGECKKTIHNKKQILHVNLLGKINKCGVIKPRNSVKKGDVEKYEKRYLPAKDFGIILISTSKGIMNHSEVKKNNIGGRLLVYCY